MEANGARGRIKDRYGCNLQPQWNFHENKSMQYIVPQ